MAWTKQQQQVIDTRNGNLLVSAAAGSGKTAVLVERIIKMIVEEKIDIDKLLIVTFTNLASSEMRERIGNALEKKLEERPTDEHLMQQISLIHKAQITTIHSFCLNLVRSHFNLLELDPSFRIADEGELKIIKDDILKSIIENKYNNLNKYDSNNYEESEKITEEEIEKLEEFRTFVESYSSGKTDKNIEELVLNLYKFSMSYQFPEKWLDEVKKAFLIKNVEEFEKSEWIKIFLNQINCIVIEILEDLDNIMNVCCEIDGPKQYISAISSDIQQIRKLKDINYYSDLFKLINSIKFETLSKKKEKNVNLSKKEFVQLLRKNVKAKIKKIQEYCIQSSEDILKDIINVRKPIYSLIDITKDFIKIFQEEKISRNILDFNDLEHFAIEILTTYDDNGNLCKSKLAQELSATYKEVLVDEYQDINNVQDSILKSISNGKNMFMVGDVKQSIYKFRLARPEIFMEKSNSYTSFESENMKIELKNNFRSTKDVIEFTNYIFYQIMQKRLGGIEYTNNEALVTSRVDNQQIDNQKFDTKTELLLIDLNDKNEIEDIKSDENVEVLDGVELEAKAIANKIKQIMNEGQVIFDKNKNEYRKVEYRDIVILLRTVKGWAEKISDVLLNEGIDVYAEIQSGYFDTTEIKQLISFLSIIDNVLLNIEMVAVLRSPIVNLSGNELATLKLEYFKDKENKKLKMGDVYKSIENYIENGDNFNLISKLKKFIELLNELREEKNYLSVEELIWNSLNKSHYFSYVGAMPQGKRRQGNILKLIEMAVKYEENNKGLFNFLKYIEKLRKNEVDYGEYQLVGDNENVVRIMSIHKSKGLEYPIVFVSGLSKEFNKIDARDKIAIHPDLYIGADNINFKKRTRQSNLIKKIIQRQIELDILSEEFRILYVALTRARDKLILTGVVNDIVKKLSGYINIFNNKDRKISYVMLTDAKSYLDWILMALIRQKNMQNLLRDLSIEQKFVLKIENVEEECVINLISKQDLIQDKIEIIDNSEKLKQEIFSIKQREKNIGNIINDKINFEYPYIKELSVKSKFSVSELKVIGQTIDNETIDNLIDVDNLFKEEPEIVPEFLLNKKTITSSMVGVAVHKILQLIDFKDKITKKYVYNIIDNLLNNNVINSDIKRKINVNSIVNFFNTDLGKRVCAIEQKNIFKEQQFVIGIPINEIYKDINSDELIMLQGIIDLWFIEDDEIVLVDYKTDFVQDKKILIDRYKVQIDYYERAITQITGIKVKQRFIYSLYLNKEIEI